MMTQRYIQRPLITALFRVRNYVLPVMPYCHRLLLPVTTTNPDREQSNIAAEL
jgi:hypothetical protein